MKHKVGDKVRIKSKAWWNAQPKNVNGSVDCGAEVFTDTMTSMCGKVVEISDVLKDTYFIKEYGLNWTDEMFEDSTLDNAEKPHISEQLIKNIAEVIKSHNLGVSVSENGGKLIIEPLKVEEEDLPIGTPCMVTDDMDKPLNFLLRYYAGNKKVFANGKSYSEIDDAIEYRTIIPCDKFNFENPDESLKYNIVKSE